MVPTDASEDAVVAAVHNARAQFGDLAGSRTCGHTLKWGDRNDERTLLDGHAGGFDIAIAAEVFYIFRGEDATIEDKAVTLLGCVGRLLRPHECGSPKPPVLLVVYRPDGTLGWVLRYGVQQNVLDGLSLRLTEITSSLLQRKETWRQQVLAACWHLLDVNMT